MGTKKGSRLYGVFLQQYLYQEAADPKKGWGIFAELNDADGNPNTLEWSTNVGLAGYGLLPNRPDDRFGVGYFYVGTSKALKKEVASVVELGDESGVEPFCLEGVETEEELAILRPLNPEIIQGYLFGKPKNVGVSGNTPAVVA